MSQTQPESSRIALLKRMLAFGQRYGLVLPTAVALHTRGYKADELEEKAPFPNHVGRTMRDLANHNVCTSPDHGRRFTAEEMEELHDLALRTYPARMFVQIMADDKRHKA